VARRIGVITGTRAEYGLLRWIIGDLSSRPEVELQLYVTGAHLSERHGATYDFIVKDGFKADALIPILDDDDSRASVSRSMGRATSGFASEFERLAPEMIVVLGDRYEILAAVSAALPFGIPVAHVHGGEVTEGAMDDSIRHAVTKLSHLHFASCDEYRRRTIQLGEDPQRVWNTGSVALDNFERLELLSREEICRDFLEGVHDGPLALFTYHPTTLDPEHDEVALRNAIEGLMAIPRMAVLATESNADQGAIALNGVLHSLAREHHGRISVRSSLGQLGYLSSLVAADVVVGNSSSGVVEAPSAGTPTVNIGSRQAGRLRAPSIIDVGSSRSEIDAGINLALSEEFVAVASKRESPFGRAGASAFISDIVSTIELADLVRKRFHDIDGWSVE